MEDMNSIGVNLINKGNPTHYTSTSSTLLDLCFTNNMFRLLLFDQLSAPMFLRHDLLLISYNFDLLRTFQYIDFENIYYQSLGTELSSLDWNHVFLTSAVDEQLHSFDNNLRYLYDKYIRIK